MKTTRTSSPSTRARPSDGDLIEALRALGGGAIDRDALKLLRRALAGRSAAVAARAAAIVADREVKELRPELDKAFARLLADAAKRDPGCSAKLAIVRALIALRVEEPFVFLAGIRHVQWEPVWGGRVDTAGGLRGWSLHGLVGQGYHDALIEAVPLLVDRTVEARRLAAQALGRTGVEGATLLLRLKVAGGDADPAVLADAFASLLAVDPDRSLPFVASYLDAEDAAVEEGAALAIGESAHAEACTLLMKHYERAAIDRRERLLVPLAITRQAAAFELLLEVVENDAPPLAIAGARALHVFRADDARRACVDDAVARRGDPRILAAWSA